jgi:hypothetical protein
MRRLFYIITGILLLQGTLSAQPYDNAVGIRAGYSSGITFRHFTDREVFLEGLALYNMHGFQFTAMYGYQFSPYAKERLHYYGAAGLHAGNWENDLSVGAAVAVGSEFAFRKAPVVIGLEWKPMISIFRVFDTGLPDLAVTLRVPLD